MVQRNLIVKVTLAFFISEKSINLTKLEAKLEAIVKSNLSGKYVTDPNNGKTIKIDDRIQFRFYDKGKKMIRPFFIQNPQWSADRRAWVAEDLQIGYFDLKNQAYYEDELCQSK